MQELTDLSYAPIADPAHTFDLYSIPWTRNQKPSLICFVHGGAWRSEDKRDHAGLARQLCVRTGNSVAVPNYRLTKPETPLRHPGHSEDILVFLKYVRNPHAPFGEEQPYDRERIYLMGHSCSAHMLASILLESPHPSLRPPLDLLRAVRGVVFSEGIYDIDKLLESFPSYREWFIAAAFGDRATYSDDAVSKYSFRQGGTDTQWLIVHSTGDTLVDIIQSRTIYEHLLSLQGESPKAAKVLQNFNTLDKEHNDILKSKAFLDIVADFVRG
ncbi:Alpha/Beta hydrolase protein [Vararia minispora EC-137]|uniref:Alpha/Beta hydrolase protein n=1 Tax=Vararia minispora EC-137 TaxID=1314806 RepID=A0ACB8QV62_9AGAM|nr:Alpha/Beta hydrolase protein [Vararia minispora EC-137]